MHVHEHMNVQSNMHGTQEPRDPGQVKSLVAQPQTLFFVRFGAGGPALPEILL